MLRARPIPTWTAGLGLLGFLLASPYLPAVLTARGHTQFESALALVFITAVGALVGFVVGLVVWLATIR